MRTASLCAAALAAVFACCMVGVRGQQEFGRDFGFGSMSPAPPQVTPQIVDNMRRQAESGSKDAQYFMGLLYFYGEGVEVDRAAAAQYFRRAALSGHTEAAANLGLMLHSGNGVSVDDRAALAWFKMAAENGHEDAKWMLGRSYYDGRHGRRDYKEALKWFRKSADAGNFRGCFYLALMYEYGLAVKQDFKEAARLYTRAADMNDAQACYNLALMYAYGRGTDQNFDRALVYFDRAASQNYAPAQYYLGVMYMHGQGVPVDYEAALVWFQRAVDGGDRQVYDKAAAAIGELQPLLEKAKAQLKEVADKYETSEMDKFTTRHEHYYAGGAVGPGSAGMGPKDFDYKKHGVKAAPSVLAQEVQVQPDGGAGGGGAFSNEQARNLAAGGKAASGDVFQARPGERPERRRGPRLQTRDSPPGDGAP